MQKSFERKKTGKKNWNPKPKQKTTKKKIVKKWKLATIRIHQSINQRSIDNNMIILMKYHTKVEENDGNCAQNYIRELPTKSYCYLQSKTKKIWNEKLCCKNIKRKQKNCFSFWPNEKIRNTFYTKTIARNKLWFSSPRWFIQLHTLYPSLPCSKSNHVKKWMN